jgi:integrase
MKRKGRNTGTIENYRDHMERLFEDWLDKPLARLGRQPNLVLERHEKITEENGPYIANGSMRSLRAVYNHARKSNTDLPPVNPVTAIDWNKERRRNTGMGMNDVGGWLKELNVLPNPLRREFHLLTLLSGSRPTALKNVRIEHIDLRRRLVNIPRPKGGEEKAFDIPLSRPMIRCIIRTIRLGRILYPEQASIWLFPAESETGHLCRIVSRGCLGGDHRCGFLLSANISHGRPLLGRWCLRGRRRSRLASVVGPNLMAHHSTGNRTGRAQHGFS